MKNVASGANNTRGKYFKHRSIHSEEQVIKQLNLLPKEKTRKIKNLVLIVIKMSHNGKLGMSKPCSNCVKTLQNIPGYNIKYVYYSDGMGNLVKTKLSALTENEHVSRYFRDHNSK